MVEWLDLLDSGDNKVVSSMVEAVMGKNLGLSQVMLSEKYLNFSEMFDKAWTNVLPQHNQHNLSIELETDKQLPFGSIYNFSRSELDVLYEYVNEMLAKEFITLSKSLLKTFMLFTNKKDRGLRLYIDYRGLNAITKKTNIYYF